MFRYHLLFIFRSIRRFRTSFIINFIGLSTGIACAFFIYLWVQDERGFDRFHSNDERLYQVMEISKENNEIVVHDGTQGPLAAAMQKDLPEVESAVLVMSLVKENMPLPLKANNKTLKSSGIFAGKDFFKVFSFPLVEGDPALVLKEKNGIVISKAVASGLFGSVSNAVGKSVDIEVFGMPKQATITGVFAELPGNNSMKFEFVLTEELLLTEIWTNGQKWWNEGPQTYLLLKQGTDPERFNAKIKDFIRGYMKESIFTPFVRPYSSGYLKGRYENGVQAGGRIEYVKLFSLIAVIILVIACINFMNLSTAKASRRLKEVGIKKVSGSSRMALIVQFLTEANVMAFISLLAACIMVYFLLPYFNQLTGKELQLKPGFKLIMVLLAITIGTGILSGSYPAFYLSKFKPAAVLKGRPKNSLAELFARKGLVVFQFVVSLVLIVSVIVVYQQLQYVQNKNIGYDKANIIRFDKDGVLSNNPEAFITEMKKINGVINVSTIQQGLSQNGKGASTYGISWPGKDETVDIDFAVRAVDYGLLETLGIQISEGRSFAKSFGGDSSSLIFNETAIKTMGLKNAIGTPVRMWGRDMTICGVVKDFHISSLHEPIAPVVFIYKPQNTSVFMAKLAGGQEKKLINKIETLYQKFNPGYIFNYSFIDQEYQRQYIAEQRVSVLSRFFAGLAILITCLGLFGLAAFNAEVRTKEIGIRKVLGASAGNVLLLLSKDFFKLVLLAVCIAFPVAWLLTRNWLDQFAYKVTIGAEVFIFSLLAVLLITVITISFQSIKAAVASPADSLRSE